jgi:GGDEF domain-containing protein
LHTLVYVLFSVRGQIDDLISIWLANVILVLTMALFCAAIYQFHGRKFPMWLVVVPVVTTAIAYAIYLNDTRFRILFGALSLSFQSIATLSFLWRQRRETAGIGQYFLIIAFAIFSTLFLQRFITTLFDQGLDLSLNATGYVQTITSLASIACLSLITMGMLLMGKERSDERNHRLAMMDALTGLPNRRHVLDVLNQQLAIASRSGSSLSMLMLDIDHFKRINDTLGHPAGDETLRQVSACLKTRIRGQDIIGRVGGEEFLVILPQTDATGAALLAETLRAEQFIASADAALYRAKTGGRNRVETAFTAGG